MSIYRIRKGQEGQQSCIVDFQIKVMNDLDGPESLVNVFNFYLRQIFLHGAAFSSYPNACQARTHSTFKKEFRSNQGCS